MIYLDGYSGPGEYEDGSPGSPSLAAATASSLSRFRYLEGHYVERDPALHRALQETLAKTDHHHVVYRGEVESHLPAILDRAADAPLFAFFDPFGLCIPFETLTRDVLGRRGRRPGFPPATEVLLNFSLPGLRRNAGKATQPKVQAKVDAMLGGDWWRPIWEEGGDDRAGKILAEYVARIVATFSGGWAYSVVPIRNRWDGPIAYWLIFITHYPPALWFYNNTLSKANEDFYEYCHEGQLDLDPLPNREARWVEVLKSNIEALLASYGRFRIVKCVTDVYGEAFGLAREMHVRRALSELRVEGKIGSDPVGVRDLSKFWVDPR